MTKFLTRLFAATLALCACANMASAAVAWPPGTGGAFPDTLDIYTIQHGLANPGPGQPSLADTVYGIGGIITGFDAIPTGFAFYFQTTGGNPFTGIDVFTGSFNFKTLYPLAVGDSVICSGTLTEFGGGTEIQGYDGVQGTNDVPLRVISHGNPLPPFFVGTTTQLKELPTNTFAEQYEGMLVRVNGSGSTLKVARTSLSGGSIGTNNSFLAVSSTAPSDSIFVEGNTLTTFAPPAVGTVIGFVQGILDQRPRGYRIQLRDGNDIGTLTPPNLIDAYPLTDNTIRVVYDRNVTVATATNTSNYSLASLGSVDAAVSDGTTSAVLTITNGLSHGVLETVTASGIVSVSSGLAMTAQSRTFVNGVLSCAEIQAPNPDSLIAGPTCLDRSRFAGGGGQISQGGLGPRLTMTGITGGVYTPLTYLADAAAGTRSGVSVFAPPIALVDGHQYLVAANVQEFFGETEVSGIADQRDLGFVGEVAATPALIKNLSPDTCDVGQVLSDGEDFEGMLVKVSYVRCVQKVSPLPTTGWHVGSLTATTSADTIFVSNLNGKLDGYTIPALGMTMDVTGELHYSNNSFRICPRNANDVVLHGMNVGVPQTPAKLSFAVYPNPSRRANIAFTLPKEADVEIGIFDVSGRQVASVAKGRLPAGSYSKVWSGLDASGAQVGSGVYFARLKAGNEVRTVRTVLLGR